MKIEWNAENKELPALQYVKDVVPHCVLKWSLISLPQNTRIWLHLSHVEKLPDYMQQRKTKNTLISSQLFRASEFVGVGERLFLPYDTSGFLQSFIYNRRCSFTGDIVAQVYRDNFKQLKYELQANWWCVPLAKPLVVPQARTLNLPKRIKL